MAEPHILYCSEPRQAKRGQCTQHIEIAQGRLHPSMNVTRRLKYTEGINISGECPVHKSRLQALLQHAVEDDCGTGSLSDLQNI